MSDVIYPNQFQSQKKFSPKYDEPPILSWWDDHLLKLKLPGAHEPTEELIKRLSYYLRYFGLLQFILVDDAGRVIAGLKRLEHLRKLKCAKIPVAVLPNISSTQKAACAQAYHILGGNHD